MLALLFSAGLGAGLAIAQATRPPSATTVTARDPEASEQALARGGLTPPEQLSTIRSVAQAHLQRKDYPNTIMWAERYIKAGGAEADVRPLLAEAHYELRDYANAARELQWEIQAADRAGRPPGEDRLLMLQSCYAKLNDANAYAWGLEKLVTYYPKREYWAELLERTQKRPDFGERLSLDVNRLRLLTGTLGGAADFITMAMQARQAGFPAEAKRVVDHGFATGVLGTGADAQRHRQLQRQLAAETLAQQRHVNQRDVEAEAERAADGIELFNLGWAHATLGDHSKGLALMEQGLRKGGLAKPQDAKLHLGIGYLMAGQGAKATDTFGKVGGRHGAADLARIWSLYARNAQ
jgi:tetratricopeptide (TPR) repeat protein